MEEDTEFGSHCATIQVDETRTLLLYGTFTADGMMYTCIDQTGAPLFKRMPEMVTVAGLAHTLNAECLPPPCTPDNWLKPQQVALHWIIIDIVWCLVYYDYNVNDPQKRLGLIDHMGVNRSEIGFEGLLAYLEEQSQVAHMSYPPATLQTAAPRAHA